MTMSGIIPLEPDGRIELILAAIVTFVALATAIWGAIHFAYKTQFKHLKAKIRRLEDGNHSTDPTSQNAELVHDPRGRSGENSGLLATFSDRSDASQRIHEAISNAKRVWVLANKGDDWVGEHGAISASLIDRWHKGDKLALKMLLLHARAPWLQERGKEKGWTTPYSVSRPAFERAHKVVRDWFEKHKEHFVPPPRFHRMDPSWRFMMTDELIFVQTYRTIHKVVGEKVLLFDRPSPIYQSAYRFFEYIYEMESAHHDELSPLERHSVKIVDWRLSIGLIVTRKREHGKEALLLTKDNQIGFSKGGIKKQTDKNTEDTAVRELKEETGFILPKEVEISYLCIKSHIFKEFGKKTNNPVVYYHCDIDKLDDFERSKLKSSAQWMGSKDLDGAVPAYPYVPEILRELGIDARWRSARQ